MDVMRDNDLAETREWRQALDSVLAFEGPERAEFLLEALADEARRKGALVPYTANTPYLNTIPPAQKRATPATARSSAASAR